MPESHRLIISLLTVLSICLPLAEAKKDDERQSAKPVIVQPQQNGVVFYTLAENTTFVTTLETPLNTRNNQANDTFQMRSVYDTWLNEQIVIPKGSLFTGVVSQASFPVEGKNGELKLKVTQLELPTGQRLATEGSIFTNKEDKNKMGGETTQPVNARLIRYEVWGIGQYNRVMPAGSRAMGNHRHLPVGQMLRVRLDKPLTIQVETDPEDWLSPSTH
jgi:hypothetical protein